MTETSSYEIKALTADTWADFADLTTRHNGGGMGGCWCTWFHRETHSAPSTKGPELPESHTRDLKRNLVETGGAHAALVFADGMAVGWAQYGSPVELPGIMHRKEYLEKTPVLPDYRITCFMVDRKYRGRGVAIAALDGALDLIGAAGGGTVEAYPQDTPGKKTSATFLYSATRGMFERAGFEYVGPKGTNHCIMRTTIAAA